MQALLRLPYNGQLNSDSNRELRVFFSNPTPTAYDLTWRMFGIPVRVHPSFWLLAALMGWQYMQVGIGVFLLWIGCTFVSILVHELGHVFMARIFGEPSQIILYSFGGVAVGNYQRATRWQRVLILLAGPGAGFLLYGATRWVFGQIDLDTVEPMRRFYVLFLFDFLFFMNFFWSVLNLAPVQPLDGGQILRELCTGVSRRSGLQFSLGLSFLCAGLIALYSVMKLLRPDLWYPPLEPRFTLILFALLAIQSYTMLQQAAAQQRHWDLHDHWR